RPSSTTALTDPFWLPPLELADRDVVDLEPGVAVRPQAGEDHQARVGTGVHRGRHPGVAVEAAHVLLAHHGTRRGPQAEEAVRVVGRRAHPAAHLVAGVRLHRDRLVHVVPAAARAHPAVAGPGAGEARTHVGAAAAEARPACQAGLEA